MARVLTLITIITTILALNGCFRISDSESSPSELLKEYAKGGGEEYDAAHHSSGGEKGEEGYKGNHHREKGRKGQHEKEGEKKQFVAEGGHKRGHHHQDGYYGHGNKGYKGQKGYQFEDKGSYAKGHKTKGHHNVHKLDEFKKNTDFYDENHDEAYKEKHGGFEASKGASAGGHNKGGYLHKSYYDGGFGNFGKFLKGAHYFDDKGHDKKQGHQVHHADAAKFAKNNGNDGFKQWGYSHQNEH